MAKRKKELSVNDKLFFATTLTSLLAILKTRFTDAEIKKLITKKGIDEVLKTINEINEEGK